MEIGIIRIWNELKHINIWWFDDKFENLYKCKDILSTIMNKKKILIQKCNQLLSKKVLIYFKSFYNKIIMMKEIVINMTEILLLNYI